VPVTFFSYSQQVDSLLRCHLILLTEYVVRERARERQTDREGDRERERDRQRVAERKFPLAG